MKDCPSPEELERFLDGVAPPEAAASLAQHVNECTACQQRLERISEQSDAGPWRIDPSDCPATSSTSSLDGLDVATIEAQKQRILATLAGVPEATRTTSRFTRLRRHARGGLSEVYVFREEPLGRDVALKVLRGDHPLLPELRRRFIREYRITSELDHPGVPPVYGVGRLDDGRDFFTMRFVGGETLARRIARFHQHSGARLARDDRRFRELLAAFRTVCETIDHAHRRGIVHRDLKPQNVQVDGRETVVLDWGLAKRREDGTPEEDSVAARAIVAAAAATRFDERIGTPAYMSPEQAAGGGARIDERTDIYGLGAILFEILAGRPPHVPLNSPSAAERQRDAAAGQPAEQRANAIDPVDAADRVDAVDDADAERLRRAEQFYARIAAGPTPRAANAAALRVPAELDAICARAMAHDPARRYASAAELADEVDHWLASQPVEAHRYSLLERASLWIVGHRTLAASAALVLVVVAVAATLAATLVTAARLEARRTEVKAQRERVLASANLVAEMLAAEIDLRWRILEAEADDRELVALLEVLSAAQDAHRAAGFIPAQAAIGTRDAHDNGDAGNENAGNSNESTSASTARQELLARLRRWSDLRYALHSGATRATSWFVLDGQGTLLARNPQSDRSADVVGGNFRFRDYFHGLGRDLPSAEARDVAPLRRPYRSSVFQSRITGTYMVAFSVPVWSEQSKAKIFADEGSGGDVGDAAVPIGILGMTIEMGRFDSLQRGAAQGQVLVLADSRENYFGQEYDVSREGEAPAEPPPRPTLAASATGSVGHRGDAIGGLILHHPTFVQGAGGSKQSFSGSPLLGLGDDRVAALRRLCQEKLDEERALARLSWREQLAAGRSESPDSIDPQYHDPIGGAYGGGWVAGFAPVLIKGRPDAMRQTGLVVVVQERPAGK